ncbi:MAG: 4'-phosphopantetheinyl transferase family protein, partial [Paludibacter sp.]
MLSPIDKNKTLLDDVRLLVIEVTDSVEELIQKFENIDLVFDEFNKFSSDKRKKEFLSIRLAFKKLLGTDVIISYDDNGKPYLEDRSYNISISHSGNWIAIIAHPTRFVGIDIECPSPKIKKLYTRFLSEAEQVDFSYGKDVRHLQLTWSAKEALYKIIGIQAVEFSK